MRLFISYARADYDRVQLYVERLTAEPHINVFWDHDISPGEDYLEILARQATGSDCLIAFVSHSALASRFVRRECLLADSKDGIQIIPVYLDNTENLAIDDAGLLLVLRERQGILAYQSNFESSCKKLIEAIRPVISPPSEASTPILSVMGTKGGVGKSSIIAAIAELIASAGHNVAIIDADVQTAGIGKYISGRALRRPHIWTVLDTVYAKLSRTMPDGPVDKGAWDVTPKYLEDHRFGSIYLIPARHESDRRKRWESIADFPPHNRNEATLAIVDELVVRARNLPDKVDCILIDSGAENNPLVSAAMVRAMYGFVVSAPQPEFGNEIPSLDAMHRERYPHHPFSAMNIIVNQASAETPVLWAATENACFVPEDPEMRHAATRGGVDFEGVGFNAFFLAILRALKTHFITDHQHLLPDEGEVWVRPYFEAMKTFPETLLAKPLYRFLSLITLAVVLVGLIAAGLAMRMYFINRHALSEFITSVTVSRPNAENEGQFKANLEAVTIPDPFAQKVWIEGDSLNVKGVLTEDELAKLKTLVSYEPARDALVAAAFQSVHASNVIAGQQISTRQSSILLFIGAVILIISMVVQYRKLASRKRFLRSIIQARNSDNKNDLRDLINAMVEGEIGKPQLRWLRSEFRQYAPSLATMIR
jgi:cellulose biosynthesis protein BcsQ